MAEPFQPKFVDLVRNTFATTGTGNITIGQPIIGFVSFASALTIGDQFYYCAINNDRPGEREVGRGAIMPDGTISRSPIQGSPVSFTNGNKVIALVTPAEWFNTMQAGGSGGAPFAASRSALAGTAAAAGACMLREAGREGLFVFDPANRSAEVAADNGQGLFVAPSGQNGSAGAWVRSYSGAANVRWFGAKGDGTSADGPAFVAALAALAAVKRSGHGFGPGIPSLQVPAGIYMLGTTTLDLTYPVRISGEGTGGAGGTASVLKWTNGTTGIRVQAFDTSGATGIQAPAANRGAESIIEGLLLHGGHAGGAESEAHGVHMRGSATLRDCMIQNFAGDGIFIRAESANPAVKGNANCFTIDKVFVMECRCGLYVEGWDANAGNVTNFNAMINRQAGVYDRSLLGNNYFGPHVAANARTNWNSGAAGRPCSYVSHGGNIYFAIPGQTAGASTNAPSGSATNNQWWGYWSAGTPDASVGIPAWTSGIAVREGGGYLTSGSANASRFYGAYAEDDQYNLVDQLTYLEPGTMTYAKRVTAGALSAKVGRLSPVLTGGLRAYGDLLVDGDFFAQGNGASHFFGPQSGAAADSNLYLDSTNVYNFLRFRSWNGGAPQTDAEIFSGRGQGLRLRGRNSISLEDSGGNPLATVSAAGLAVTGAVTASNLSGTNSGDQVITLTGDVTGSGGGSFAASIASNAVSYAKMQDVSAASRLIGRGSSGAGDPQEITLGSRLSMSGTVLNVSGDWNEVTLASDFTCANSTSFNDITDGTSPLTYTPPANSAFEIQAVLMIQTVTATNLPRVQVNVAAQGSGAFGCVQIDQTGATASARVTADGSFTTSAVTVATVAGDLPAANTPYMCFVTVRGRTGASPAAIRLQAACETAANNACFVKAGSQMRTKAS